MSVFPRNDSQVECGLTLEIRIAALRSCFLDVFTRSFQWLSVESEKLEQPKRLIIDILPETANAGKSYEQSTGSRRSAEHSSLS